MVVLTMLVTGLAAWGREETPEPTVIRGVVNREFHHEFVPCEPDLSVEGEVVIKAGK